MNLASHPQDTPSQPNHDARRGIDALYATGHWLVTRDRPEDAACVFRAMTLLAPGDERAWLGLSACHEATGQPSLALEIYGTAQALLPGSVRCRLARARLLRSLGREEDAEYALDGASEVAAGLADDELMSLVAGERVEGRGQ